MHWQERGRRLLGATLRHRGIGNALSGIPRLKVLRTHTHPEEEYPFKVDRYPEVPPVRMIPQGGPGRAGWEKRKEGRPGSQPLSVAASFGA